jgi:hypothetical protein
MRSPMTSRSNCANDNRTLGVKRPIEVVVLNCCVTDTNDAPFVSRISTILAIGERAGQPVDLVDDDDIHPSCRNVGDQPLQGRPIHRRAGEPAIIISLGQAYPAFMALTANEGLAGLALRLQRIEFLLEPFLGGFAGVDRTANPYVPPSAAAD